MKKKQKTEFQVWKSTMRKLENKIAKEEDATKLKKDKKAKRKELAEMIVFGIGVNAPFWAYFLGWL